jgi:hypothetical protein
VPLDPALAEQQFRYLGKCPARSREWGRDSRISDPALASGDSRQFGFSIDGSNPLRARNTLQQSEVRAQILL